MKISIFISLSCLLISMHCAQAQESIQVSPIGRIHLDGAAYLPTGHGFNNGMAISEIRVGGLARYQDWTTRIEIGYSYGKIGLKDIYMQKKVNQTDYLRLGYFIPQFGIRGGGSSSMKPSMLPTVSESFFRTMNRKVGVMYTNAADDHLVSASAFVGGRSMTLNATQQGLVSAGASLRSIIHPFTRPGAIFHAGVSLFYETASHTQTSADGEESISEGFRSYSANFPTAVSNVPMLKANLTDITGDFKLAPEIVASKGPFALESQASFLACPSKSSNAVYSAFGTYTNLRLLINGDNEYRYNNSDASLSNPGAGSLELVAAFDYTNSDSNKPQFDIHGISRDYSLTLNYYINKYMIARLRYSTTNVSFSSVAPQSYMNAIQARLQFVF